MHQQDDEAAEFVSDSGVHRLNLKWGNDGSLSITVFDEFYEENEEGFMVPAEVEFVAPPELAKAISNWIAAKAAA